MNSIVYRMPFICMIALSYRSSNFHIAQGDIIGQKNFIRNHHVDTFVDVLIEKIPESGIFWTYFT